MLKEAAQGIGIALGIILLIAGFVFGVSALVGVSSDHTYPVQRVYKVNSECYYVSTYTAHEHGFMWWEIRKENLKTGIYCERTASDILRDSVTVR